MLELFAVMEMGCENSIVLACVNWPSQIMLGEIIIQVKKFPVKECGTSYHQPEGGSEKDDNKSSHKRKEDNTKEQNYQAERKIEVK